MTASPTRRRNRTIAAALAGALVLGLAPTMGYAGWNVLKDSKAGTAVKALDEIAFPSTPTAMIAVVDDQKLVVSLAVMVLSPSPGEGQPARGGTLVSIPTNANRAQTATEATLPVADSVINSGEEGLLADVESLTRVTINSAAVLDRIGVSALLTPVGPLSVTLPNDVVTTTATGATETLFVSGATTLAPEQAVSVLLAREAGKAESRRLANVRAVWDGLAKAVGAGITAATPLSSEVTNFDQFIGHFLAGPVQVFNDLETTALSPASNPDKLDKLDVGTLDVARVVLLMASLAPSAMITPNPTLNFRIENGLTQADVDAAGLVGVTPADVTLDLVGRLLFLQGNVVSVSPSVFTPTDKVVPDVTVVFSADGLEPVLLDAVTKSIGELSVASPPFVFPLVDIVIVVGRSYLKDMARARSVTGGANPADTVTT